MPFLERVDLNNIYQIKISVWHFLFMIKKNLDYFDRPDQAKLDWSAEPDARHGHIDAGAAYKILNTDTLVAILNWFEKIFNPVPVKI